MREYKQEPDGSVTIYVPMRLSVEDIDDLMSMALDGGITYWCRRAEVNEEDYYGDYASEQIARGGSLTLYDAESEDKWVLTLDKLMHGLVLALENGELTSVDPDDWDADTADIVVQLGLFDTIVFG